MMKVSSLLIIFIFHFKIGESDSLQCYRFCVGKMCPPVMSNEKSNTVKCQDGATHCIIQYLTGVDVQLHNCASKEQLDKCPKLNNEGGICINCRNDFCNDEKAFQREVRERNKGFSCYDYCTGNCPDKRTTKQTSPCPKSIQQCIAIESDDRTIYSCDVKLHREKCIESLRYSKPCVTCRERLCNTKTALTERKDTHKLKCYQHCTGKLCNERPAELYAKKHVQNCYQDNPECLAMTSETEGSLYECVDRSSFEASTCSSYQEDKYHACIKCETELCNTEESVRKIMEKYRLRCYQYCLNSLEVFPECKDLSKNRGNLVICPPKADRCRAEKIGDTEIYNCATSDVDGACKENNDDKGVPCQTCIGQKCNSEEKFHEEVNSRKVRGVSACYIYDRRLSKSITYGACINPHITHYECVSIFLSDGGSFTLQKGCIDPESETGKQYKTLCKYAKPENPCYFCKKNMCNKGNSSADMRETQTETNGQRNRAGPHLHLMVMIFMFHVITKLLYTIPV